MPKLSPSSVRVYYPKLDLEDVVDRIKKRLPLLQRKLRLNKVILFGSYAQRRYTASSDIDLLVVYRPPKRKDDYPIVMDTLRIMMLEPHIYVLPEYERIISTNPNFKKIIEKEGVVIFSE